MEKKAISMTLILLGVLFIMLAASQVNQMIISNAQSELARPIAEGQIAASEELAKSYGQTDAQIAATSKEARALLDKSISTMGNSYMFTALMDGIIGLLLLIAGLFTFPKQH
ncbi:hypothetical protein HY989_06515 [Candidatus Micrarchaeota archaeon]|nr:hypothetical protein [Candidatus Micrarchaeota archaeon]